MMRPSAAAMLESTNGDVIVLEDVRFRASIDDLLAEVTVEQRYRNPRAVNIEAVYTFPLPLDAVLLAFEVEIGGRRLAGRIVEKVAAEREYEDAITDGDAAILLEQAEPGLYTASIGNLLPGETATIRFRYGLLLRWNGDRVRFMMPTTIAPRYGDPEHLPPHQVPEYSFDTERSFGLEITIRGLLRGARFSSPTHAVSVSETPEVATIKIDARPSMDRDFVLEAELRGSKPAGAIASRDLDGWVALASFRPEIPAAEPRERRSVKIVVDCSGSMGGDSIAQARAALERIFDGLQPGDLFDILAFGSTHQVLFDRETPVSAASVAQARRFARGLDANMGGTEISGALKAAYAIKGDGELSRDILLITDGEVWNTDQIIADARSSGHRIFTVGVGSSVAEGLVRGLAEATGGACELVAPREDMAHRIHRHFQRMYAPLARRAEIRWPVAPSRKQPETIGTVFDGDTLYAFGWFADRPTGRVALSLMLADGRTTTQEAEIHLADDPMAGDDAPASTLARLAAARRLDSADTEAPSLALRYQLMSPWTSCVVVDVRPDSEKAEDLPETVKVRQVLAAGWHGLGTVHNRPADRGRSYQRDFTARSPTPLCSPIKEMRSERSYPAKPVELRLQRIPGVETESWLGAFIAQLNKWDFSSVPDIDDLESWGIPDEIADELRELVESGNDEEAVVISFLYRVTSNGRIRSLDRSIRRKIAKRFKEIGISSERLRNGRPLSSISM